MFVVTRNLLEIFRSERASVYSLLASVIKLIFAPLSLYLVALKLTPELQGYYYLFFSIAGMQQIAEAGFSHTSIQGIAHEMANVTYSCNSFSGERSSIENIISTIKLGSAWYLVLFLISLFIITPIGILFMYYNNIQSSLSWFWPWIVFMIFFSFNLLLYPVSFFLEGIQEVGRVYQIRFYTQLITVILFCLLLYFNMGLYCVIASSLVSLIMNFIFIYLPNRSFLSSILYRFPSIEFIKKRIKWQFKVSFVWSSGYLYWQLPTLIVFKILGPVVAGKYGMTINIINSIVNLGQIFVQTKAPVIGMLRNSKRTNEALSLFYKSFKTSMVLIILIQTFFCLSWLCFPEFRLFARLIDFKDFVIFSAIYLLSVPVLNWAMFCRCSKEEPFFYLSIFVNFCFPLILIVILRIHPYISGVIYSFLILFIVQFIWGYNIFRNDIINKV